MLVLKNIESKQLSQHLSAPSSDSRSISLFPLPSLTFLCFGKPFSKVLGGTAAPGQYQFLLPFVSYFFFFHCSLALTAPLPWCRSLHHFKGVPAPVWGCSAVIPAQFPSTPLSHFASLFSWYVYSFFSFCIPSWQGTMLPNSAAAPLTVLWD